MTSALPVSRRDRPVSPVSILRHAVLMGLAGDALLRGEGIGISLWIGLLALTMVSLAWESGRVVTGEAAGWLLVAVLFSAGIAWRDAEELRVLNSAVAIGALGMTALSLSNGRAGLFARRLRDTVWAGGATVIHVAAGLALLGPLDAGPRSQIRRRLGPIARATLITSAFLLVFGSLLRSADPIFASLVVLPAFDLDAILSHLVLIGFCTWVVGGWARTALLVDVGKHSAPDRFRPILGVPDILAALGTLIVLFAAFIATQLGWFFGGERFLHAQTGLTAAEYARGGFFQMLWVAVLVVGVLLGTRTLLGPGRALARLHLVLSLPVVVLLAGIILSAGMRMRLYIHYYGLTTDRLYPLVFMGWLGVVLVWLTLTVLRGWGRPFVAGAVLSGLATLAALNIAAPDAIVARVNLARAAPLASGGRPPLDLVHLAGLSAEAVDLAVAATLAPPVPVAIAQRCEAARLLLRRWGSLSNPVTRLRQPGAWRSWNAGEAGALQVITDNSAGLRAVCPSR